MESNVRGGDTELYQHPANFFNSLTGDQKAVYEHRFTADRDQYSGKGRGFKNLKRGRANLIPQPQAPVAPVTGVEGGESEKLPFSGSPSPVAEPLPGVPLDAYDFTIESEAKPVDKYGVSVPCKRARGSAYVNNRIVSAPPVKFEEHEIGLRVRRVIGERSAAIKKGTDPTPNPPNFHYYQRQGTYNAAHQTPEELDQSIVKRFKLHPSFGLPLARSVNPDDVEDSVLYEVKTRRWEQPIESQPVSFVARKPDGSKEMLRTSRSHHLVMTEKKMEEVPAQRLMLSALSSEGELSRPQAPQTIAPELLDAADAAAVEEERINRAFLPAMVPTPAPSSSSFSLPALAPATRPGPSQRSHGYDPVRDTVYQTPYSQPRPAPAVLVGGLDVLADAAISFGAMPPSSSGFFHNPHLVGAQSHLGAQQQHHRQPSGLFYAHPPPPSMQYGSPRTVSGSSNLRELLPAPPRNRGPSGPPRWL